MSNNNRHDYTKHSNKQNNNRKSNTMNNKINEQVNTNNSAPVENSVEQLKVNPIENTRVEPATTVAPTKVDCPVKPARVIGKVVNCVNLNCREEPIVDATVICRIGVNSEVVIDEDESTDEFYKICTECGYEGYCMKKYIEVVR